MEELIFQTGIIDFVVFHRLNETLSDDKPICKINRILQNEFWNNIKSKTWSCNCKVFCVINEENIIVGGWRDDLVFVFNKTGKVFDEILNYKKQITK